MRRLHGTTAWIPELSSYSHSHGGRPPPPSRQSTAEGAAVTMGLVNVTEFVEGGGTLSIGSGEGTRGVQSPLLSPTVSTPDSNHHRWIWITWRGYVPLLHNLEIEVCFTRVCRCVFKNAISESILFLSLWLLYWHYLASDHRLFEVDYDRSSRRDDCDYPCFMSRMLMGIHFLS